MGADHWFDERFLSEDAFAIRAMRRLRKDEIIPVLFDRHLRQNPVERDLGISRVAMLAGFNLFLRLAGVSLTYAVEGCFTPLSRFDSVEATSRSSP